MRRRDREQAPTVAWIGVAIVVALLGLIALKWPLFAPPEPESAGGAGS